MGQMSSLSRSDSYENAREKHRHSDMGTNVGSPSNDQRGTESVTAARHANKLGFLTLLQEIYPNIPRLISEVAYERGITREQAETLIVDAVIETLESAKILSRDYETTRCSALLCHYGSDHGLGGICSPRQQARNAERYAQCIRRTESLLVEADTLRDICIIVHRARANVRVVNYAFAMNDTSV